MKKSTRYEMRGTRYENGSALILAVVLTSLLAIVGVLFLMISRVDRIATSAISQNRELDMAVDAVIARIAEELALDVPGNPNNPGQEYYDYPDVNNAWLASLEPYEFSYVGSRTYRWRLRDLSDIYGVGLSISERLEPTPRIVPDYQDPAEVRHSTDKDYYVADADGDGVSDSAWVELPNITSGKGWPIYATIRVIDNSAMLNVNTAYKFDPCEVPLLLERIDGSSQMQINLMALASQPGEAPPTPDHETDLLEARANNGVGNVNPMDLDAYEENVIWRYGEPNGPYTPFDISDELELRNRFLLNHPDVDTRLEVLGPVGRRWGFREYAFMTPVESEELDEWFVSAYGGMSLDQNYAYRHIATTYNMDRIIAPRGGKMVNVNNSDRYLLYDGVREALLDAGIADPNALAAQIAVNIKDFRDGAGYSPLDIINYDPNDNVTPILVDGKTYYGFERPCVYISELVYYSPPGGRDVRSYAIELYKPYFEDNDPCDWRLVIDNSAASPPNNVNVLIDWSGTRRFHVIEWQDPNALLLVDFLEPNSPNPIDGAKWVDPEVVLSWPVRPWAASYDLYLGSSVNDVNLIVSDLNEPAFKITDYDANGLVPETVYYWRVDDDVNKGDVWMFTTAPSGSGYSSPVAQAAGGWSPGIPVFDTGSIIKLQRFVPDTGEYITVDSVPVEWLIAGGRTYSFQRDITLHKCIRRLWDSGVDANSLTLGYDNIFVDPSATMIQAHPYLDPDLYADLYADVYGIVGFKNIGEIGKVLAVDANGIRQDDLEEDVRIDLANPDFQQIFNYLTVFDPVSDGIDNDGDGLTDTDDVNTPEWKVPGRININTAPWYVIAQLPWVTPEIAQAIVAYRDKLQLPQRAVDYSPYYIDGKDRGRGRGMVDLRDDSLAAVVREAPGFASITELLNVTHDLADKGSPWYEAPFDIRNYGRDKDPPGTGIDIDQPGFPDLIPEDGAANDLEERDLIFARISNLVTVRSDVFTAYILVRIGTDGPQKRVIAILDRSNVYADGAGGVTGSVRVRALHPVPDPR